jgi:hypothetical protein
LTPDLLAEFDTTYRHLECDGMTFVLDDYLSQHNIDHTVWSGTLVRLDQQGPKTWTLFGTLTIPARDRINHKWIMVSSSILDLRARMWFGADAPHGLFTPASYPAFEYQAA